MDEVSGINRLLSRRRFLVGAAVAAGAATLLAACGNPAVSSSQPTSAPAPAAQPQQTAPAAGAGVVTVDWWVPNFQSAGAQPMKAKFEAAYPHIKVNQIETVSNGLYDKIFTTLQGNTQPDLIDVANGWNPIFSQANLVMDLSSKGLDQSDWLTNALGTAQYQGKLFGVPFRSEAIAMLWNKDIFQAAGLDPNTPPLTWEDLLSMAQKTNQSPNRYGFGLIAGDPGNSFFRVSTFLWANGGDVLSSDFTQAVCDQPQAIEAVQYYTDLATKYHVAPDIALTATTEQMDGLFVAGKVALHETGQYIRPNLQQNAPNLQWGVHPTPKRQTVSGPLGGWNWVIPAKAQHADAAWTLVNFMAQPENMADMADKIGVFPSRKTAIKDPRFQDPQLAPFAEQLTYAKVTPPIQQWADVQKAFITQIQAVIAGQSQAPDAMKQAASDINALLKKS
jgi:multiple sugar transport system substrate-binding protein